ncbi:DUF4191 domain-containing protein [Aestuariimicrobium ganziense]|uniref:DUF4191 domain-containing protein n=1 Tax=Aestuariimicrobium ganziense TaxID=2773677 RepID=UPI00194413AB|nr:DUF4191 domain-containing protein [Aestuariimicrobium ganziense]
MASEKAKELARQQKAAAKAEKLRRKNSDNPRDWGQWKQITETYKLSAQYDKKLHLYVIGAVVACILLGVLLGLLIRPWWMWTLIGLMFAAPAALFVLLQRSKKATYSRFAGQAGSGEVALNMLDKKWTTSPAIAVTRQMDVVHRALGPTGLYLIGEGDPNRIKALLATEAKRHEQASRIVKPTTIIMGDKDGQVPLPKLAQHIKKQPKTLDAAQIADVASRLKGLDAMRPKVPLPKGPLPTRVSRNAMRGR